MLRRLVLLAFGVFLIQETSLGSLFLGAECVETCPDDGTAGRCPPTCATCSCGTHVNPVPPDVALPARPSVGRGRPSLEADLVLADRYVGEILHVPRPAVA